MGTANIKILIVDDVQTVRVQIKEILKLAGYEQNKSAMNGLEALQELNASDYHLAIIDWHMDPMNGLDLVKEIRSKDKLKNISIIMLTAETTKEKVMQAVQSGIDDYIVKPFTPDHAQLKITQALLKRKHL